MTTEVDSDQVTFENAGTGLSATNVEAAIKELDGRLITFKKYRFDITDPVSQIVMLDGDEDIQSVYIEGVEQCDDWTKAVDQVSLNEPLFAGEVVCINTVVQA